MRVYGNTVSVDTITTQQHTMSFKFEQHNTTIIILKGKCKSCMEPQLYKKNTQNKPQNLNNQTL